MRSYEELLSGRAGEIESHLSLIEELTAAAIARQGIANLQRVEMEHVDVLKSGFLVHLYNVVEAVMTKILEEVAADVIRYPPAKWSSSVRTEWVRTRAGVERGIESHQRLFEDGEDRRRSHRRSDQRRVPRQLRGKLVGPRDHDGFRTAGLLSTGRAGRSSTSLPRAFSGRSGADEVHSPQEELARPRERDLSRRCASTELPGSPKTAPYGSRVHGIRVVVVHQLSRSEVVSPGKRGLMSKRGARRITAIDLFCGVGGLTQGLGRAGIDVVMGVDLDPACRYAFEANNAAAFVNADVMQLRGGRSRRRVRSQGGFASRGLRAVSAVFDVFPQCEAGATRCPEMPRLQRLGIAAQVRRVDQRSQTGSRHDGERSSSA